MKQIIITIQFLDGKLERQRINAPHGRHFNDRGVDQLLAAHATYVEQAFPSKEFRLVPLAGGRAFNFVEVQPAEESQSA